MPAVSALPECPLCFGRLLPMSVCRSCNVVAVRGEIREIGSDVACEDCGASNPSHFVCSACHSRFPYGDIVKPEGAGATCPSCKSPVPPRAEVCPNCHAVLPFAATTLGRLKRRIQNEYGEDDIREVSRIPNLGRQRAEALCRAGYNRLWKIQQSPMEAVAAVEGIGPESAAKIREGLRFLLVVGQQKTKDDVLSEEYECPLCGTATSLFATRCYDCDARFDPEELDEEFRREIEKDEEKGLLAYYDVRLLESPDDLALLYARGVLLLAMGHPAETLNALDAALELAPGHLKSLQAKARALAAAKGLGGASQVLRETLDAALPPSPSPTATGGPSLEAVGELRSGARREAEAQTTSEGEDIEAEKAFASLGILADMTVCPECGEPVDPGASICSACGHRLEPVEVSPPEPAFEGEHLLADLERAMAGEEKAPPPPLEPEVAKTVITGKRVMLTFLSKIPGVSKRAAEAVSGFFQDLEQVGLADVIDIADIPGVAPAEARLIKVAVARFLAPTVQKKPEVPKVIGAAPEVAPPPPPPSPPISPPTPFPAPEPKPIEAPSRRPGGAPAPRPSGFELRRGMVNGRGHVNGKGRVNGIINGTGFVNGISVAQLRLPRRNLMPRYVTIGLSLLMLFGLVVAYISWGEAPKTVMEIDGLFGDWDTVPAYSDGTITANRAIHIMGTGVNVEDRTLFLRVEVEESMFSDPTEWATMYAFLDVDGDEFTGYDLGDLGADFAIRVSGSGHALEDSRLLRYDASGRARDDWAGFATVMPVDAAIGGIDGREVEVSVPQDALGGPSVETRIRFAFDDNAGETSHTRVPVKTTAGALRIEQTSLATTLGGGVQPFLSLTFTSLGGEAMTVRNINMVTRPSGALFDPNPIPEVTVPASGSQSVTVNVDATGLPPGTLVTAIVTDAEVARTEDEEAGPFAVLGAGARAYVVAPPPGKVIDGLFADWSAPMPDTDPAPVRRRSMNILSGDGNVSGDRLSLYARLGGDALEGGLSPGRVAKPPQSGPGGGPSTGPGTPPPPLVGQDYIRFFVDTDSGSPSGFEIGGVFADRLLEVRGRGGRVLDASVYSLVGADWVRQGSLDWGLGADELEVGANLTGAGFNMTQFVAVSADWSGIADLTDSAATRTRGDPGLVPLDGTNFLTAIAKPLTNTPTVDGNCESSGSEYGGSDIYSNANVRFLLGRRSDTQFVYVCLEVTSDGSDNTADWGELLFDQEHEDSSTPQANDRRFRMTRGGTFSQEKGDGSTWTSCGGSCDAGNAAAAAFNNSIETYEFKTRFSDVWGDNSPLANERAGFAVMAHNDGVADYTWGSDNVNQDNPGTWGRLDIPEFPAGVTAAAFAVMGFLLVRRRRRLP